MHVEIRARGGPCCLSRNTVGPIVLSEQHSQCDLHNRAAVPVKKAVCKLHETGQFSIVQPIQLHPELGWMFQGVGTR